MRLAVLADIHGNLPALEAVLADVEQQGADGIVAAGDYWGGPQNNEVVRRLAGLEQCWMIRGNREEYLASVDPADPRWHRRQWAMLRWGYQHLERKVLDFLLSLPAQRVLALPGTAPIRVVHGSPREVSALLFPDRDAAALRFFVQAGFLAPDEQPPSLETALVGVHEPLLVCGHSHIAWQQEWSGGLALNPGSVGEPLQGDPCARYALLTWQGDCWCPELRAVPYDLALLKAAFEQSSLLAEGGAFARASLLLSLTGQNYSGRLVGQAYRLAAEAGYADCDVVPDDIWERTVATFDWPA